MMRSAGLLVYRRREGRIEVLLVHPGGPFFARKDDDAWSVPKGLIEDDEEALTAARREFAEELGSPPPEGRGIDLGEVRQKSGKRVVAWGVEGDFDESAVESNTFRLEWPPKSGVFRDFPEIDRAAWLDLQAARRKMKAAQRPFLDRLEASLGGG